jgi:alanine-alpha-ketoisovalerate/valine-pyruvate aminotransferase
MRARCIIQSLATILLAGTILSLCLLAAGGCDQTINIAERALLAGEKFVTSASRTVGDRDMATQEAIINESPDLATAKMKIADYRAKRTTVVDAIVKFSGVLTMGRTAIDLARDGKGNASLSQWVTDLEVAAIRLVQTLKEFGVTVPGLNF